MHEIASCVLPRSLFMYTKSLNGSRVKAPKPHSKKCCRTIGRLLVFQKVAVVGASVQATKAVVQGLLRVVPLFHTHSCSSPQFYYLVFRLVIGMSVLYVFFYWWFVFRLPFHSTPYPLIFFTLAHIAPLPSVRCFPLPPLLPFLWHLPWLFRPLILDVNATPFESHATQH